jgi:hypothetical protein
LKAAFALVQMAEAMPSATPAQERLRSATLEFAKAHAARLQQVPEVDVNSAAYIAELGRAQVHQASLTARARLEMLAREVPEVAALLSERDDLAAEVDELRRRE